MSSHHILSSTAPMHSQHMPIPPCARLIVYGMSRESMITTYAFMWLILESHKRQCDTSTYTQSITIHIQLRHVHTITTHEDGGACTFMLMFCGSACVTTCPPYVHTITTHEKGVHARVILLYLWIAHGQAN